MLVLLPTMNLAIHNFPTTEFKDLWKGKKSKQTEKPTKTEHALTSNMVKMCIKYEINE